MHTNPSRAKQPKRWLYSDCCNAARARSSRYNFPIADVHMAIIAVAYYTLFCVGLTNIYLATPSAAKEE